MRKLKKRSPDDVVVIKVKDRVRRIVAKVAKANKRSIPAQVEYWAMNFATEGDNHAAS